MLSVADVSPIPISEPLLVLDPDVGIAEAGFAERKQFLYHARTRETTLKSRLCKKGKLSVAAAYLHINNQKHDFKGCDLAWGGSGCAPTLTTLKSKSAWLWDAPCLSPKKNQSIGHGKPKSNYHTHRPNVGFMLAHNARWGIIVTKYGIGRVPHGPTSATEL